MLKTTFYICYVYINSVALWVHIAGNFNRVHQKNHNNRDRIIVLVFSYKQCQDIITKKINYKTLSSILFFE